MILLILNFLSGCWNRRELNELAITVAMAIDKSENQFVITTQIVNPGEFGMNKSGVRTPVTVYQEKGDTLFETLRRMTTVTPRKLFFPHLRIIVISEEFAKEGIGEALDFLRRDHEVRTDFYIIIAKETKAENVLKVMASLEDIPANKLFSSLETSEKSWAPTMGVTLDDLLADLASEGKQPQLTGIQLIGDFKKAEKLAHVQELEPDVSMTYSGLAVFKEDKLIGWLDEKNSKGLNYLLGNVKSTIGITSCPEEEKEKIGYEVIRTKSDLKAKVEKGSPKGIVQIEVEANVGDVQCRKLDLTKTKTIKVLEKKSEEKLKEIIESTIKVAQEEYKVDIFGFGNALHRANPDYWNKVKQEWDVKFAEMPIEIKADVKIRRAGGIGNSPLEKIKE
jgi:spore germination protein KC